MTWTNAFNLGECTVAIVDWTGDDPVTMFSGVMTKEDSHSFSYADRDFVVSVDANGTVALDGDLGNFSQVYEVNVIPSYPHDFPARISNIALAARANSGTGFTDDAGAGLPLDDVDPPTPDPLDMSAIPDARDFVGLHIGFSGFA